MNTLDTEFGRRLDKRLEDVLTDKVKQIITGHMEHGDYKHACGYVKAIKDVAILCEEIDKDMRQGK